MGFQYRFLLAPFAGAFFLPTFFIKNMKYILILLFAAFVSNAQIQKEQLNLMPWPQNINLTSGTFALSKNFRVNITGNPNPRIFIGATRFLRRLDSRTGLFLEQSFLTKIKALT